MAAILSGASITIDELREIYDTAQSDASLANYVNMAYLYMKRFTWTDADLQKHIELLLAAHFATVADRVVKSQSIGGEYNVTYGEVLGPGLEASTYGSQAIVLDDTGQLKKAGMKRAKLGVISHYDIDSSTYLADLVRGS